MYLECVCGETRAVHMESFPPISFRRDQSQGKTFRTGSLRLLAPAPHCCSLTCHQMTEVIPPLVLWHTVLTRTHNAEPIMGTLAAWAQFLQTRYRTANLKNHLLDGKYPTQAYLTKVGVLSPRALSPITGEEASGFGSVSPMSQNLENYVLTRR